MKFFRELRCLCRYLWKTDPEAKRILFYAEHEGYHAYFEGLLNELTQVHGVTLCYITSDFNDPVLTSNNPAIKTFYISSLLALFMAFVKCRVFVMTLTDLDRFHLKRSLHPVHYVYVFHSMVSTHMMYRAGAFDHYDSILLVGPHHLEEIRAYEQQAGLPAKKLIEAGYYRLERIRSDCLRRTEESSTGAGPKTVLVAPSWGEHHLLKTCGPALVESLLAHDYRVIVRPHPETVRRDPQLLTSLQASFGERPGFQLELSVATDVSLLDADLLICDLSGVALEYALGTERPVLFVDVPPKVHNSAYRDLGPEPVELALRSQMGAIVAPDALSLIPETVGRLIADCDRYRDRLARLRDEYVYQFGHSSEVGADHILRLATGERPDESGGGSRHEG